MTSMEGWRLGAYELLERIGGGGMAEVYLARQRTAFGREVAIKVIRSGFSEEATFRERFLREAQAISRLSHPNILPLIEFGEQGETLYLVMPLAREGTLRDRLKQQGGALPPEEAVPLFTQLCAAVQYAHQHGIIHRDLKPQNVLLQERTHVLLADFGIARDTTEAQPLTTTGAGIGTVEYMAPEQALGQATKQSDIYSLGVVLYQLVTGRVPYTGSTPFQVLTQHVNAPLPDPRAGNPHLPAELVQVLQHALAKDPAQRFSSAQALARAVQQVRADAPSDLSARTGGTQPPRPPLPRSQTGLFTQTTRPSSQFREPWVAPEQPESPDDSTLAQSGGVTGAWRASQTPPPGGASGGPAAEGDNRPTWRTHGESATGTAPGWQQRGRGGSPPVLGSAPVQQPPAARRKRRLVIGALGGAALLLLVLASLGAANALGLFTSSASHQITQEPTATAVPQATGTAGVPVSLTDTPGSASTSTPGLASTGTTNPSSSPTTPPTQTLTPTPTSTRTPTPTSTRTPTPTPNPFPNVAGTYHGSYSNPNAAGGFSPMTLQITQSGSTLSGTVTASGTTGNLAGTIASDGSFTFSVTFPLTTTMYSGSLVGSGQLSGTYANSSLGTNGTWSATLG